MNGSSLQKPKADTDYHGKRHAQSRVKTENTCSVCYNHPCQAGNRSNRKVNSARNQNHRHTDCGNTVIGIVLKHVDERAEGCETNAAEADCTVDIDQDKDTDGGIHHHVLGFQQPFQQALTLFRNPFRHAAHLPSLFSFLLLTSSAVRARTEEQ